MDESLSGLIKRELDPGETVIWRGQPEPRRYARRAWAIVVLASVFCGLFGAIGIAGATARYDELLETGAMDDASGFVDLFVSHPVWLLAFSPLLGIAASFLAFPLARRRARNTVYALTDRRAIVLERVGRGGVSERDYSRLELCHLRRREDAGGVGDLYFEGARGASSTASTTSTHGFFAIPDVLGVERLVRSTARDDASPDSGRRAATVDR